MQTQGFTPASPQPVLDQSGDKSRHSPSSIKKGSIIVWRRGQCGYHSTYGHIEIAVDDTSSRACSDFCGSIRKTCGNPYVYYPTTL